MAQLEAGNILDEAIVFIEDTKEIWNHGTYFDGSTVDLSNIEASIENILDNIPTKTSDLINDNGFISNPIIPEQDGIYAVTSDERIISLDEADETCIALALIKGPHKFWIDKYQNYSADTEIFIWNNSHSDTGIPNQTVVGGGSTSSAGYMNPDGSGLNTDYTTWTEGTALGDFNGKSNSEILKTLNADYRNIGYALNQFNNGEVGNNLGHNDWYIPSAGQAAFFCLYRDELDAALATIGGTAFIKTSYWTSTEYATRDSWYINLWDYSVGMWSGNKTSYTEFRLRLIRDIRTLDERFDDKQNTIIDLASIREGAALGATAIQPEAISDMETKTNAAATYATKTELNTAKTEAQSYTDTAISNLVDSAPDTLNTLNELATAIQEHQDITDALDAAITNKANKAEAVIANGTVTAIVALTQAEYDALSSPSATTLYIITD